MRTGRLEAFSDGVLAIIITIMVLEFHVPAEPTWHGLAEVFPTFSSYLLSFIYVGIYWNNHHHLMQLSATVTGGILWANLHLLFWLSLIPFFTRWMDESGFALVPVLVYGLNLLLAAVAFSILQYALLRREGPDSPLAAALGRNTKGRISPLIYVAGCALTFVHPLAGVAAYAGAAALWLIPNRRMEALVGSAGGNGRGAEN